MIVSPRGESFKYVLQLHFPASNNVTEYEALLHELRVATVLGIKRAKILGDSLLVINQENKEWTCSDVNMLAYCQEIQKIENRQMSWLRSGRVGGLSHPTSFCID